MKFILYRDLNTPLYIINDKFEFFYYSDKSKVSEDQQAWLIKHISDFTLPEYSCINVKTGEKTTSRILYEKSLKTDLYDPKTLLEIDTLRNQGINEANIASEFKVSKKTLQRRYPRATSFR